MPLKVWKYEKKDTRDDVKVALPDTWTVDVYKVTSGDSGETYWVQVMHSYEGATRTGRPIYLCDCPPGKFLAPLSILGLGPQCKHATNLAEFLQEKSKK